MEITLKESERLNYGSVYLETLPELASAVGLYESLGFKMLKKPLGESGHFACNLWMLKENWIIRVSGVYDRFYLP